MGYEASLSRNIKVRLRNTIYDGAEAMCESLSVGEFFEFRSPEKVARGDLAIMEAFYEKLLSWNLELEGEPVPPTPEGGALIPDKGLVASLAWGWVHAVNRIERDSPLPRRDDQEVSTNGSVEFETL